MLQVGHQSYGVFRTSVSDIAPVAEVFDPLVADGNIDLLNYLTIPAIQAPSAYELLGHEPLGRVFYDDLQQTAHKRYGIDVAKGALVVTRPDGWVGTMTVLDPSAVAELETYFKRIFASTTMI